MAELATLARPYAEALFEVASKGDGCTSLLLWTAGELPGVAPRAVIAAGVRK